MALNAIPVKQFCPIAYVGELNGIHYYLCEDCSSTNTPPDTEIVGDDRLHDIGSGCPDCPDPIWAPSPHSVQVMDKGLKALIPDGSSDAREAKFLTAGPHVVVTEEAQPLRFNFQGRQVARAFSIAIRLPDPANLAQTKLHPIAGTTPMHTPARIGHLVQSGGTGGGGDTHVSEPGRRHQLKVKRGTAGDDFHVIMLRGIKQ